MEMKVCFISDAGSWAGGRMADISPKADSPHKQWGKNFYKQSGGGAEATCRNNTALTIIFKLVISDLTSIILSMELWQFMSWIQSGHRVVIFSTWGFSIYKTAHSVWLRILSTALDKGP